jgi:hypothetical protein
MKTDIREAIRPFLPKFLRKKIDHLLSNKKMKRWIKDGQPLPPPHIIKQKAINQYQKENQIHVFVETGTYLGKMVEAQMDRFRQIYSIELSEELHRRAHKKFKKYPQIQIIQGDSGQVLQTLVPAIEERAIFWLDGHYSAGITAKGNLECPVYEELSAIFKSPHHHIILIDDARCFIGQGDYPTLQDLSKYILNQRHTAQITVKNDILRIIY